MFYVMPRINIKVLEETLRGRVIRMLVAERKLAKIVETRLIASLGSIGKIAASVCTMENRSKGKRSQAWNDGRSI
ncbi:hypothetical protein KAR34_00465 [bacterium]|nr:hypothetical protein [bacterium]